MHWYQVVFIENRNKMSETQIQSDNSVQHLLGNFSDMPLKDIEYFIRELNALVVRKRVVDKEKRNKFLIHKINQTVLPEPTMQRYIALQEKMELEQLTEPEYTELLELVAQEEKIRNKRFQYLIELSQLQNITLPELMKNLGLNTLPYA